MPIVLIHGFRGTHHGLELIAERLGELGYRVYVPDLPGFGEATPLIEKHTIEAYVSWLKDYINSLDLKVKPVLLGHSFGSIIASGFASLHSDMIDRLVLENPIGAPALEGPRGLLTKVAQGYFWIGKVLPERLARPWISTDISTMVMSITMAKTRDKQLRKFIHSEHRKHFSTFANTSFLQEAFTTSVSNSVRDFAHQIPIKTLLIIGDKDDITSVPQQEILHGRFPDATLHIIPGVGHLTHYETPGEVAERIDQFCKSE